MKNNFKIKIYLNNLKKPLEIIIPNLELIKKFYAMLENSESKYMNIENIIIFDKREFKFLTVEEIKLK